MNEQGDPLALLKLPSAIDGAREHGGLVANGVPLPRLPPLRLIIAGPAGAGKTTLARAILGDSVDTARVGELRGPTGSVVEYRPALHGDARRSRPEVSGGLLVVDVPSRNLAEWGMVVVDTPGVDAGAPDSFAVAREVARAACTAVLYVVPDRGCGEADVRALERLRSVPTVLIHNLRMLDVSAHSPPIIGLPTPTLAAPAALPLALSRLAGRGREWDCLREAIAVLWQLAMPEDHLINLLRITVEQQRRLRDNYAARLDAILVGRHSRVRAEQLQMTADLVHHRRQGALLEPLDDLLSGVAHLVLDLPAPGDARQSLGSRAREALNAYNVETVTRRSWSGSDALAAAASSGSAEDTIGSSLRQHREALGSFVAGIAEDDPLQLTMEEADLLRLLSDEIKSERFEIVVVGQFSAGKSSLINALLGVAPGVDLLPTKLEPTTTTVNHLMYGPEVTATVEWAESLDQMVLIETDTNHGQPCYRVHVEELRALSDWLDRGEVKLADCELLLSSGRTVPGLEAVQGLSRLTDAARIASASPRSFLYDDDKRGIGDDRTVPDCEFPYNVDIRRFAAAPREVPQTDSLTETIDIISKSPSIALRVSRLVIQHPNELLRHVTLVDTPGTDAPMPGHRIKTREAVVDDRDRAVIYCFDGDKPG
ncbi:MAG: dynamin family protein, partial [Acidimicrobiia bacterium]